MPDNTQLNQETSQFNSYAPKQPRLSGCLHFRWHLTHFVFMSSAAQQKHIQYWNFAGSRREKLCLDPKGRLVRDTARCLARQKKFLIWRETSNQAQRSERSWLGTAGKLWTRTVDEGPEQKDRLCANNEDESLSENYALAPGKLFHTKTHRISPCPWACHLAAAWSLEPVNWVTRLNAFLPSPAKKTTSRWYLLSQPRCSTPHPASTNKQH